MKSIVSLPSVSRIAALLVLSCSGSACKSDDAAGSNAGASAGNSGVAGASGSGGSSAGGGSAGAVSNLHGSVVVSLRPAAEDAEGYTALLARFFDGPTPNPAPLKLDTEEGDCRLLVPNLPFCNEPCSPDVCTANDECTPYPKPVSIGTLAIDGLSSALALEPTTTMFVYQAPSLPNPPCTGSAAITATSSSFDLKAQCISQLELTGADPIPVTSGEPVQVSWEPPATAGDSRIRISLDISHHGGKKGQVDCEVADTGSFEIPEALVTKLVGLGLAGYPTINVNRVSVGTAAGNDTVELVVSSDVTRAVDTGVLSCQDDAECPEGQTCQDVGVCG